MSDAAAIRSAAARFDALQRETRRHRREHGCGAYTFEDGAGLLSLARAEGAGRVIELGTAIGYTACLLASATPTTRVDTIERDPRHVALAREKVLAAGLAGRVTVLLGDFAAVLPGLDGPYDLAFFDGFAPTVALVDRLRALLRPGGLLVCGNLGLADPAGREALERALGRADRWRGEGRIEAGATQVFRKIGPGPVERVNAPATETR